MEIDSKKFVSNVIQTQWGGGRDGGGEQLQAHAGPRHLHGHHEAEDYQGLQGDHEEEEGESYLYREYQTGPARPGLVESNKTNSLIIDHFSLTTRH